MAKARLEGELGFTDAAFVRGINNAIGHADRFAREFTGKVGGALLTVGKWTGAAMIGGITAGAAAAGLMGAAAVKSAAGMETMRIGFEVLLGSAEAAGARMEELAKFGAATPFELPEIAAASRTLQSLTKGALATGEGLTMVGDLASATQQPFEEMAVSVGRLYAGLMAGQAVGEPMQRLTELGILAPEIRAKIEQLQKQGKKGAEVWGVFADSVGVFNGMMAKQSASWNGLFSTMMDGIGALSRGFGEPLMQFLKPGLQWVIENLAEMEAGAKRAGQFLIAGMKFAMTVARGIWAEPEATLKGFGFILSAGFAYAGNQLVHYLTAAGDIAASLLQPEYVQAFGQALLASALAYGASMIRQADLIRANMAAALEWALQNAIEFFDGGWKIVADNAGHALKAGFMGAVNALKAGLEAAFQGAKWVWDKILVGISKMPGIAKDTRDALAAGMGDISGMFKGTDAEAPREQFKAESFSEIRDRVSSTGPLKDAAERVERQAAEAWAQAGDLTKLALNKTSTAFAGAVFGASQKVKDVFGADDLMRRAGEAKDAVIGAGDKLAGAMDSAGTTAAAAIRNAGRKFENTVAASGRAAEEEAENAKRFGFANRGEKNKRQAELDRQEREFERGVNGRTQFEKDRQGMSPEERRRFDEGQREADFNEAFRGNGPRGGLMGPAGGGLTADKAWQDQFKPRGNPLPAVPAPGEKAPVPKDGAIQAVISDESVNKLTKEIGNLQTK